MIQEVPDWQDLMKNEYDTFFSIKVLSLDVWHRIKAVIKVK